MVDDQPPVTTLTLADSRMRQGIHLARLCGVVGLLFAGMGLLEFAGQVVSVGFYGMFGMGLYLLLVEFPDTGLLDRVAATFTVRYRHLIGHRTVVYPLAAIRDVRVSNRSILFILDKRQRIMFGPFTDVTATAQQIDAFFAAA